MFDAFNFQGFLKKIFYSIQIKNGLIAQGSYVSADKLDTDLVAYLPEAGTVQLN